jgi:Cys-tRNA(Pro)/Cys-tRNA(Cys) deacylase
VTYGVNNITRLLDSRKIPYQAFDLPAEKHGALETARILNVPPEIVFKTIVVVRQSLANRSWRLYQDQTKLILKQLQPSVGEKKVVTAQPA